MKELTTEQKAERYDKALEKAKNGMKLILMKVIEGIFEEIFSELKESEDEKIRKKLLSSFKDIMASADEDELWYGLPYNDIIVWLEKQGKDSQVICPTFTFDDILALQCCMETAKKVQEDKELYEQLQSLHDRLHDTYWLEKQGENTNPYSGISFEYNGHIWGMCARDGGVDILLDKQLLKHIENPDGQKPTNNHFTSEQADILDKHIDNFINQKSIDEVEQVNNKLIPKFSVWSEEDTFKVQRICRYLDEVKKFGADITEVRECINWIKSLKERYI